MSSAFFVKGAEHDENDLGDVYGANELDSALLDFLKRLVEGNDEHVTLTFSA